MSYFDFEPLIQDKMPTTGSKVLRSLQNQETPLADLLVREAIQNSLDASLASNADSVTVSFNTSTVPIQAIHDVFPELQHLTSNNQYMLEIRDLGTEGLTGVPHFDRKSNSNFSKLVYDLSNPQEKKDAGGSWGLGKTIYYRVGIGLIVFYSKIQTSKRGVFKERLAACFIEDERKESLYLPNVSSGIAWWGERYEADSNVTQAVENVKKIGDILRKFGVQRFKDGETGTSIMIFGADKSRLDPSLMQVLGDSQEISCDWFRGVEGYLESAIQRWYCIRLNNDRFRSGPKLSAFVNGKRIKNSFPIFQKMQELYNAVDSIENHQVNVIPINIKNAFYKTLSGHVITAKFNMSDLGMLEPDNHRSPYEHIECRKESDENNKVIFAFVRKPGMIINWFDPGWVGDMTTSERGKYIVALFVPNSDNLLHPDIRDYIGADTFEGYLRSTEKSDHSVWHDVYGFNIIKRIRRHVIAKINKLYIEEELLNQNEDHNYAVMRYLAKAFMPEDWGNDARVLPKGSKTPIPNEYRTKNPAVMIDNVSYPQDSSTISVEWSLYWGPTTIKSISMIFEVLSENGIVSKQKWDSEQLLGSYPCWIDSVELSSKKQKSITSKVAPKELPYTYFLNKSYEDIFDTSNDVRFRIEDNVFRIADLDEALSRSIIKGKTLLRVKDHSINFQLNLKWDSVDEK